MPLKDLPNRRFRAFLFDMDGTLISSIASAERAWKRWSARHGLDAEHALATIHGKRAIDSVRLLAPAGSDIEAEAEWITQEEIRDVDDIVPIDGAQAFLAELPPDRWAIVTSAPLRLARARLQAAGIEPPPVMVTGDDVSVGKPDPTCYRLAAERLGVAVDECLVFEDADAGIEAGEAVAGAVLVITATHTHPPRGAHDDVRDYRELAVRHDDGWLSLKPV